jgi:hypothetical protein
MFSLLEERINKNNSVGANFDGLRVQMKRLFSSATFSCLENIVDWWFYRL